MIKLLKNITVVLFSTCAVLSAQPNISITFSEIMFNPSDANSEFIELVNISGSPISLTDYKIIYSTSSADVFIPIDSDELSSGEYAVVFEGDYDFENGVYNDLIPDSARIFKLDNNAFGRSGMANTSDRILYLVNSENDTIDSYTYSADNSEGISDEKIELTGRNENNWSNSKIVNGTPGFKNSISPLKFDLSFSSMEIFPEYPSAGEAFQIKIKVENSGINQIPAFSIKLFNDEEKDSSAETNELIYSEEKANLLPGEFDSVEVNLNGFQQGEYLFIARVEFEEDRDKNNNFGYLKFSVSGIPSDYNDIVVNEIMYSPQDDEPEWIELYNRSVNEINLSDWKISDASGATVITDEDVLIDSGEYLILGDNENILNFYPINSKIIYLNLPSLNNSGDVISIKNKSGKIIDSLFYDPEWGGDKGISLERINSDENSNQAANWSGSQVGATPGEINSVTPRKYDLSISNFSAEKDFVIIPDQIEFEVDIKNNGLNAADRYSVNLFYDVNQDSIPHADEIISTSVKSSLNAGDSVTVDFQFSEYHPGNNFFIAQLDYERDEKLFNNQAFLNIKAIEINEGRNDIVINEFMSSPFRDDDEWIEIFNRSSKEISLKNYQIADNSDTSKVVEAEKILIPGEYFVIMKDSLPLSKYALDSNYVVSGFPALNNSGDKIILLDSINRIIDSLEYNDYWEITPGYSTERLNSNESSTETTNWITTQNPTGGTPGLINSVTQKDLDMEVIKILSNPENPLPGDDVMISALVKNIGRNTSRYTLKLYSDTDKDELRDDLLEQSSIRFMGPGDSLLYNFSYIFENISETISVIVYLEFMEDQDTLNNTLQKFIVPGTKPASIIVNEFKFLPEDEEPEWIEFYNRSRERINIKNWMMSDLFTSPDSVLISKDDFFIEPEEYFILSEDSLIFNYYSEISAPVIIKNIPTLNNNSDAIIIKDSLEITIDSVFYYGSLGRRGYSLERISAEISSSDTLNWLSSISSEKGTPGRMNSVTPKTYDLILDSLYVLQEFPVSGDEINLVAEIKNIGLENAEDFSVTFFLQDETFEVQNVVSLASQESIKIVTNKSFRLEDSAKVFVEINFDLDEEQQNNFMELKIIPGFREQVVLINEVMYSPNSKEPEWVEFINVSEETINLKNWMFGDILPEESATVITEENVFIQPDEFFVIANQNVESDLQVLQSSFSLANNQDGIILYDFRGAVIDSLFYSSCWGGEKGISLERFSLTSATNDSTNWGSSLSKTGNTMGQENSIINLEEYNFNSVVFNEIMYDPDIDNSEFIEIYNYSKDSINIGGWKIEDGSGNIINVMEQNKFVDPSDYFVVASDSSLFLNYSIKETKNINCLNSDLNLSKNEETLYLKDYFENIIDSISYDDSWHNSNILITNNRSLEKVSPALQSNDPSNWSTCVNQLGATPLEANSIYTSVAKTETNLDISPNPFSPDGDGFEDFTIINYQLKSTTSQIRLRIFDSRGRLVRTLADNYASASEGSIIFNGFDDNQNPLRIGIYIIFLEALDNQSGVIETLKDVVVVARQL